METLTCRCPHCGGANEVLDVTDLGHCVRCGSWPRVWSPAVPTLTEEDRELIEILSQIDFSEPLTAEVHSI